MAGNSVDIEVYRGASGMEALAQDWELLAAEVQRPRFCHDIGWWRAYLGALENAPEKMYFFLFRDASGPLAILPLRHYVTRRFGLRRNDLAFPDHPHMPFHDVLCRPTVDISALLDQLRVRLPNELGIKWDIIRLDHVLGESQLACIESTSIEKRGTTACAYFICDPPYERLFKSFSKNFQSNLKKAHNRWAKTGGQRYLHLEDQAEIERYFPEFLRIEASGWKGNAGSGTAIALDRSLERFYLKLIEEFSPRRRVRLNCLLIGDQMIAAHFCLLDNDTLYLLKMTYDEEWQKLSPGNILLEQVIRDCAENGPYRYLNLVADMDWHSDWLPHHYEVYQIRCFGNTPLGKLSRLKSQGKTYLRSVRDSVLAHLDRARGRSPGQRPSFKTRYRG